MKKLGVLGFGKMGSAIVKGVLDGLFTSEEIVVFDKNPQSIEKARLLNITVLKSAQDAFDSAEIIMIAVKPQDVNQLLKNINVRPDTAILSIAAGLSCENIERILGKVGIVRVMPNINANVQQSASCACFNTYLSENSKIEILKILNKIGTTEIIEEKFMNTVVPICGSLNAFLYYFIQQFVCAAKQNGFDAQIALRLAAQTMYGSAITLKQSEKSIEEHIQDVCSKGGATFKGLEMLENHGLSEAVKACFDACQNRSTELGAEIAKTLDL